MRTFLTCLSSPIRCWYVCANHYKKKCPCRWQPARSDSIHRSDNVTYVRHLYHRRQLERRMVRLVSAVVDIAQACQYSHLCTVQFIVRSSREYVRFCVCGCEATKQTNSSGKCAPTYIPGTSGAYFTFRHLYANYVKRFWTPIHAIEYCVCFCSFFSLPSQHSLNQSAESININTVEAMRSGCPIDSSVLLHWIAIGLYASTSIGVANSWILFHICYHYLHWMKTIAQVSFDNICVSQIHASEIWWCWTRDLHVRLSRLLLKATNKKYKITCESTRFNFYWKSKISTFVQPVTFLDCTDSHARHVLLLWSWL